MAFISLPLEHGLSAQEGARALTWEENALKHSSSSQNTDPLGNLEELQMKKRGSGDGNPCIGPQGPAGPQGPVGPLGPPGPPGCSGVSAAYGSFFTQQVVNSTNLDGRFIPLQISPNFVSRHTSLSPDGKVQLDQPGDYFVEFGVGAFESGQAGVVRQVALSLNSSSPTPTPVSGTTITLVSSLNSDNYSFATISTIVRISVPQTTLAIIFIPIANPNFIFGNNTNLDVTAFLTVHKLNDVPSQ